MIDPVVRDAGRGDVEQLVALQDELRVAASSMRGGGVWLREHPPVADWVVLIEDGGVVVGVLDDVVVGYLVSAVGPDDVVRIREVWVTEAARELGYGDELLALAIEHGRERGAVAVEGFALPGDRHTKNLYERAGIVARLIVTYREL